MDNDVPKKPALLIGHYLAEKQAGAAAAVEQALDLQATLEKEGIYRSLGSLLAERTDIDQAFLDECLTSQRADILAGVALFSPLPPGTLLKLASAVTTVVLPANSSVFRSADEAGIFYVVISGSVRVWRRESDRADITLGVRGPGEGFGEISLLTGARHSSSADTLERTSLIEIPRDIFLATVFTDPRSAQVLARTLAERLLRGYGQIVEATETEHAYRQFIADQLRREEPLFIGNSPVVMKLIAEIETLAGGDGPLLVTGEPGTELRDGAGLIHDMGRDGHGMLMSLDAKSSDGSPAGQSNEALSIELNQYAALFGRGHNALPFAPDRKLGLLTMAVGGTVVIESVECLAPRVQERLAEYLETGAYTPLGEPGPVRSNARVIATSSAGLGSLAGSGAFDQRLLGQLTSHTITVPPLRRRKMDIAITTAELIRRDNRRLGKSVRGIDEEAYRSLMGYDWPGNAEELRVVIRRAVSISQGDRLSVEDIFIGPPPVTGKYTLDLLSFAPVRKLFQSRRYPRAAHFVTIPFIALIIGLGLFGPQEPGRNLALPLTWGFWEPALVVSALFAGRLWCSVCPLGAISVMVRKFAGLKRTVPSWIRNRGFLFTAAGIALIFWLESVFDMPASPRATALLVIPLASLAALAGLLYQRRTWCRYLCPLGGMMGVFASTAIIEMRSNYGVCNSTCMKHECYAGTGDRDGCPMFEGPFALRSNRNCVLCGNCVKVCPNRSPVLNLRLPGYELWTTQVPDRAFAVLVMVLAGTQLFRGFEHLGLLAMFRGSTAAWWAGTLAVLIGSVVIIWFATRMTGAVAFGSPASGAGSAMFRAAYALVPLVFTGEAGFHIERFLTFSGQFLPVLGRQMGIDGELPGFTLSPLLIKAIQFLLVAAGTAGSAGVLGKMVRSQPGGDQGLMGRLWPVLLIALTYLCMFLAA